MSKTTFKMPLFNFRLRDVDAIEPFGGERQHLHWFGLTDGWFWLTIGETELFRYRDDLIAGNDGRSRQPALPYADYYVARIWEDLIDGLPDLLDPVPRDVIERFAPEHWQAWVNDRDDDAAIEAYVQATEWWQRRSLPTGYLPDGPSICCWTVGDVVHLRWDTRRQRQTGRLMWTADSGTASMPVATFLTEVRFFDTRLMTAMDERVTQVQTHWLRPDVAIDLHALLRVHADRTTWLDRTLGQIQDHETGREDWDHIRHAMDAIETLIEEDSRR